MEYLNNVHRERFNEIYAKTSFPCKENQVVAYILGGNDELYRQYEEIFNYKKSYLKFDVEDRKIKNINIELSNSTEAMLILMKQLTFSRVDIGINEIMRTFDRDNLKLALNAIELAYNGKM